jgi:P-type conjugative transfer protein TrbG
MKLSAFVVLIVSLVSASAGAQEVPAIGGDSGAPPTGIVASAGGSSAPAPALAVGEPIVLGPVPRLSAKEKEAVRLASDFRAQPDRATLGENGRVTYLYGSSVPTIVCAPLFFCSLELQPGEIVNDVSVGAPGLWKVGLVTSGAGAGVTSLVTVKPVGYGASFTTNLMVTTDRRSYIVQLTAHPSNWMARVSFAYPEDAGVDLAEYRRRIASQQATTAQSVTVQSYQALDFNYKVSGRTRFKPTRVYTDGLKTIVEFPRALSTTDAPALLSVGPDGKEELVNYRQAGNLYIVDLVMDKGVLVSGTGRKQQRVSFTRTGG